MERVQAAFDEVRFVYVPRSENMWADALASLASCAQGSFATPIIIHGRDVPSFQVMNIHTQSLDGKPWYYDIQTTLEKKEFPHGSTPHDKQIIVQLSRKYFLCGGALYRRSYEGRLMLCVDKQQ